MGADAERQHGGGLARSTCRTVQRRPPVGLCKGGGGGLELPQQACEAHVWASPQLLGSKGLLVRAVSRRHKGLPGVRRVSTRPLPTALT